VTRFLIGALIAANMAGASPALAQNDFYTAKGFLTACTDTEPTRQGICAGIVAGFIARDGMSHSTKAICRPEGVTNAESVSAVTRFIKANPQLGASRIGNILFLALPNAYPCPLAGKKIP
jgi:hypothetical protein